MLNLRIGNQENRLKPRITVIGVGGAGGNAVNNMIHSNLEGCEFLVCNTDAQALEGNSANHKIQLGAHVTRGLGAGANPEIGRAAAEESIEDILGYLEGSNMVFVTAGMGGGTGTGAAPAIAQAAREAGILTIGVVTKPFQFEGTHRMRLAESGITELQKHVDTLIVIPNQNLFRIANEKTTFADAFRMADEVLQSGVRGVTDLMVMPGLINLDFADVRAVMAEMGKAMMGTGYGEGERRATEAAEKAISNPLLDGVEIKGAKGVLINVIGGSDITLFEVDEAVNRIREEVDPDANIIFGSTFDENLSGGLRISVVATGIDAAVGQARGTVGDTARRPITSPARSLASSGGGYAGFAAEKGASRASAGMSGGGDFLGAGAIPSSIIPSQAAAARPTVTASAGAPQPVATRSVTVRAGGPEAAQPAPAPAEVGHAEAAAYTGGSAARKLEESENTASAWTTRPAVTQSYDRSVPAPGQPRAARMGNAFIPPKPVDPHAPKGGRDLFAGGEEALAAPAKAQQAPAAPAKPRKSPSLFERFSLRDRDVAPAPAPRAEVSPKLSVEDGGKAGEEDLDIPAFLRRQAN